MNVFLALYLFSIMYSNYLDLIIVFLLILDDEEFLIEFLYQQLL